VIPVVSCRNIMWTRLWDYVVYFVTHCCVSVLVMDDWKLKTTVVVRLERPGKRLVWLHILFG